VQVRVIDLDGSVADQPFVNTLGASDDADTVEARDLAPKLRIVANRAAARALSGRIAAKQGGSRGIYFLGSGDFHHLTLLLLKLVKEPVTLIHFDNHPDWVRFGFPLNCGSWINRALELPMLQRVITIGPSSDDLSNPELKAANLAAIREGRLEVYAYRAAPTRLWGAPVNGPGVSTSGGRLFWRSLANESWPAFLAELKQRLPHGALWFSIDKDVLSESEAVTNWDQGEMQLDQVIEAVKVLSAGRQVAGIDICGDYSEPRFSDPLRAFLSWTDRENRDISPAQAKSVNTLANERLIECAREVL